MLQDVENVVDAVEGYTTKVYISLKSTSFWTKGSRDCEVRLVSSI